MNIDYDLERQFRRRSKAPLATMSEMNLIQTLSNESFE